MYFSHQTLRLFKGYMHVGIYLYIHTQKGSKKSARIYFKWLVRMTGHANSLSFLIHPKIPKLFDDGLSLFCFFQLWSCCLSELTIDITLENKICSKWKVPTKYHKIFLNWPHLLSILFYFTMAIVMKFEKHFFSLWDLFDYHMFHENVIFLLQ